MEKITRYYDSAESSSARCAAGARGKEGETRRRDRRSARRRRLQELWARRFPDPVTCFASGWMRVRARARQRGVELPLVISDHADWDELTATIAETGASEVWVTHGHEDALVHWCEQRGLQARPLASSAMATRTTQTKHGASPARRHEPLRRTARPPGLRTVAATTSCG